MSNFECLRSIQMLCFQNGCTVPKRVYQACSKKKAVGIFAARPAEHECSFVCSSFSLNIFLFVRSFASNCLRTSGRAQVIYFYEQTNEQANSSFVRSNGRKIFNCIFILFIKFFHFSATLSWILPIASSYMIEQNKVNLLEKRCVRVSDFCVKIPMYIPITNHQRIRNSHTEIGGETCWTGKTKDIFRRHETFSTK